MSLPRSSLSTKNSFLNDNANANVNEDENANENANDNANLNFSIKREPSVRKIINEVDNLET